MSRRSKPRVYRRKYRDRAGELRQTDAWYTDFTVPGLPPVKGEPLRTADEAEARKRAGEMFRDAQRKAVGLTDPLALHAIRPVEEHLADFEVALRANKVTEDYRRERMAFLNAFVTWARVTRLADLDTTQGPGWIAHLQEQLAAPAIGKRGDPQPLSARSLNKRRAALRQWGRWLTDHRRLAHNPFLTIPHQNEEADRRYLRGALGEPQLLDLFRAVPFERGVCYVTTLTGALRRKEVGTLEWAALELDAGLVTTTATRAKNRRRSVKALHPLAVALLRELRARRAAGELQRRQGNFKGPRAGVGPTDRVFHSVPTVRTLQRDLEAAGCPTRVMTAEGEAVIDFHALRHTLATLLASRKVGQRIAQAIMRHSSPELTAKTYQHVELDVERAALATILPGVDRLDEQSTDDQPDPKPGGGMPRNGRPPGFISRRSAVRVRPSLSQLGPAVEASCSRGAGADQGQIDIGPSPSASNRIGRRPVSRAVSRLGPRFRRAWRSVVGP